MRFSFLMSKAFASSGIVLLLIFSVIHNSALAHHPFGMGDSSQLSTLQGFTSGIGHPLLGPDHLLFILAIACVGLRRPKKWVLPLISIGLGGSALAQLQPLPDLLMPWAETLVSLSLAIEGLIVLNYLSSKWLLPMFALHGYLLGTTIIGAEPTPLIGYFLGLLLAQGALLLLVTEVSKRIITWLGKNGLILNAGILIGTGLAFSWVTVVD